MWLIVTKSRIKKIMQTDEEVGKITRETPVLVCMNICYIN